MCLPYPLPSHRPACGCQESRFLAVPAPHACACLCTLSGPLFIQAPRFTRWYGWSSIKSDDEDNFISDLVSQQRHGVERRALPSARTPGLAPAASPFWSFSSGVICKGNPLGKLNLGASICAFPARERA
jgi:hypothetical protein